TGYRALYNNINGNFNVGIGVETLFLNTSGDNNTALGYGALTGITTGNNNIGIGFDAEVPSGTGSNQVKIGNSAISYAGIQVDWSITSDKRWKNNIRELPYGLDIVMQLQPVDYTRKNNPNKTREMGFIAQDLEVLLEKVGYTDQGFLTKDDDGYLSVRYNDLIALLTKALQEQQLIIEAQNSKDVVQDKFIKEQGKSIEDLVARLNLIESKSTN
ncbi:tail fiber domain-containing protein, partial [Winogradskyella sp.]|uniref:tail fiber domain-containing protein n=1 Tax=Winogradskyella sp. TaxID=1883156 RepID=UPI0025D3D0F1